MVLINLLAALKRFTREASAEGITQHSQNEKDDPDSNKERVETQQEEVSKATNEEPQIKKEDAAANGVINQVVYHNQSSSAKREQVSTSNPPDNAKQPPLNEFPTKDQNIPNKGSVGKVTEKLQSDNTVPVQSHPNPPNPSSQQLPPAQPNNQPSAEWEPSMSDLLALLMQTKDSLVAKADETNVKIDAANAKVDKTSAEIIIMKQEKSEVFSQLRSQVKAVVEEVTDLKDNIATIREDSKKAKEDIIQYVNEQLNERFAKWDERQTGPGIAQKKQVEATPEVMLVGGNSISSSSTRKPIYRFQPTTANRSGGLFKGIVRRRKGGDISSVAIPSNEYKYGPDGE